MLAYDNNNNNDFVLWKKRECVHMMHPVTTNKNPFCVLWYTFKIIKHININIISFEDRRQNGTYLYYNIINETGKKKSSAVRAEYRR